MIDETDETEESLNASLQVLIGGKLSSVTFGVDYWQLDFDGNGFNVTSKITVSSADWSSRSGEPGFRDRLCEQIGKVVSDAEFEDDVGVFITFEDGCGLHLSTQADDYNRPEAIVFRQSDDHWWVV